MDWSQALKDFRRGHANDLNCLRSTLKVLATGGQWRWSVQVLEEARGQRFMLEEVSYARQGGSILFFSSSLLLFFRIIMFFFPCLCFFFK